MSSFCEIILVGNLGGDATLKYTEAGTAFCKFSLAVNRPIRVNDEWQSETTWFRITIWGDTAERMGDRLKSGQQVLVVGDRIEASTFMDKQTNAVRSSLEVTARTIRLLGRRDEGGSDEAQYVVNDRPSSNTNYSSPKGRGGKKGAAQPQQQFDDYDDEPPASADDIPF